ncbi:P-loop NTPase family protein [Streptomyces triticirhizae]|uniref:Adenylyl-sulfate kinase n=1 Tax=Streptomyces triticirhizae TaxID=2483353 RepID=A0A3M2M9F9_9ACTN|nr:hypothetical protein [Streptomyces triticirhizae]RMI46247.1 hypothetical protein EBN88_01350 [Streptomyces triticirhizae]
MNAPLSGSGTPFPVLWLCGPPGVGKSTSGWLLYQRIAAAGTPVGYVDIDQLGMIYPEPEGDPGRYRLKTANLASLAANHRLAGARCLVVSGVVDPLLGVDRGQLPGIDLTLCGLTAPPDELSRRCLGRGTLPEELARVLAENEEFERAGLVDRRVDTGGLPPAKVVERVLADWRPPAPASDGQPAPNPPAPTPASPNGPVATLLLCGARGVGTSTVGWEVAQRLQRAGLRTGFVDLGQVGFLQPAPVDGPGAHRLRSANLAALLGRYATRGTRHLVAVGSPRTEDDLAEYRRALAGNPLTVGRLTAGPETLADRVRRRGAGEGPQLPGDLLIGRSEEELAAIAAESAREARRLADAALGDLALDTDDRSVGEIADVILRLWGHAPRTAVPSL